MRSPAAPDDVVRRLRAAGCVFAEDEAALLHATATDPDHFERLVAARTSGVPLELVLGWADVAGVRVRVEPGVFVPRQRTALMVDLACAALPPGATDAPDDTDTPGAGPVVVDLCCGTGALGLAVLARRPDVDLRAADLDPDAVACARRNLADRGLSPDRVGEGDLFAAVPGHLRGRVVVLLVNAPYVPSAEIGRMPPEARVHEHRMALDGGSDGLDVHRRVAAAAPDWLAPGGVLLVEVAPVQVPAALALMAAHGLTADVVTDDERDATAVRAFRDG